jgi:hypothetical protein
MKEKILIPICLLLIPFALSAQDASSGAIPPDRVLVEIEITPEMPKVGRPLVITLLVDYHVPDAVMVIAPPFPPPLVFDRLIKAPKSSEGQIKTSVEYLFIPNSHGLYILEPFTVISPFGTVRTQPIVLDVSLPSEEKSVPIPRITWEGAPSRMTAGEKADFTLRVSGLGLRKPLEDFFTPVVPRGAVLETSPMSTDDKTGVVTVRFSLIPMEAGEFRLNAKTLYYENIRFEVPGLRIHVNESVAAREETTEAAVYDKVQAPFPEFDYAVFDKSSGDYRSHAESIYNEAKDLWDSGLYAQAMATLRRNERDHPSGAFLQPLRRKAEENLEIFNVENENYNRRKFLLGLAIFFFMIVIIIPFICFILFTGSLRKKAVLVSIVVLAFLGFFFRNNYSQNGRFGVTVETTVRRVADYAGEELFIFKEGQPVVILQNSSTGWLYVRANEAQGVSGWIPEETVVFY